MPEHLLQILLLGLVQGAAELLPVSSSAHVIVVEKLLGLDPSSPEWTFLLVMLHTGTMFAVIVYFWNAWRRSYFSSRAAFIIVLKQVILATICTAIVGLALDQLIEKVVLKGGDFETLFPQLPLLGIALLVAGVLIIISGIRAPSRQAGKDVTNFSASVVGAVQGVCILFRGLSRSGATISTGLLAGVGRLRMEEFSFALAVVITPPAIARELWRLVTMHPEVTKASNLLPLALPGIIGMGASFVAGLLALRLLSRWLETGRWQLFGVYCLAFAVFVFALAAFGV
ncbi:MAG TPA: undecaprenyl-diphosphate phosphatase [Chthoniobacterales bacterium]|nr:undecaprenyl-diphosphate phosphatase [Chthoniobacterales bacterium]